MLRLSILVSLLLFAGLKLKAQGVCETVGDGLWENASTWTCDSVTRLPASGDQIYINAGDSVTVTTANLSISGGAISLYVYGTLYFTQASKLDLPCNSGVSVLSGGLIHSESEAGENSRIRICGVTQWRASDGPVTDSVIGTQPPAPLPVQLISFNAVHHSGQILVDWSTASETNNSHFILERSRDAVDFTTVVTVAGAGNSNRLIRYNYTERKLSAGTWYYRLRQVDYDGTETLSDLIAVDISNLPTPQLYPNPAKRGETVTIEHVVNGAAIMLYDLYGRKILAETCMNDGMFQLKADMPPGRYVVSVISGPSVFQLPLIITR